MPRHRWNFSRLTSRVVQLCLLAAWIALVVWKAIFFASEPTGSETSFVDKFHRPYITVCPYHGLSPNTTNVLVPNTSYQEQVDVLGDGTLVDLYQREGFTLLDMMPWLENEKEFKADPKRENHSIYDGNWTTIINYAKGGLCQQFEVTGKNPHMPLARRVDFQETAEEAWLNFRNNTRKAYTLHVHRLQDFWGAKDVELTSLSDAEMHAFDISDSMTQQEIVINVERESMPNMWRRPCAEDPSYSRSTCWRDCFFDSLNCSMTEGRASNKPLCEAVDLVWYIHEYETFILGKVMNDKGVYVKKSDLCNCPRPCVVDRYNIFFRPSFSESDDLSIFFQVSFGPVMRLVETRITYGVIDLLSDMGGFLGLFLGYSILSVFDDLKNFLTKFLKRRRSRVQTKDIQPAGGGQSGSESDRHRIKTRLDRDRSSPSELNVGVYSTVGTEIGTAWSGHGTSAHSTAPNSTAF